MDEFRRLLGELVPQYGGSKQDLARAIGIPPSSLSRLLSGRARSAPGAEVCLRLATVTGTSASKILRAAGKGAVADLLEDLYGAAATRRQAFLGIRLTPHEQRHVTVMRSLAPKAQRAFFLIVDCAAAKQVQQRTGKTVPFRVAARP